MYVSSRLTYSPIVSPAGSVGCRLTTCAVSIPTKGSNRQTSLVNVYYSAGSSKIAEVAWLKNLNPETGSWVVAGDFNVSHRLWDATATHSSGLHLADAVFDSNLILLNDGSATRIGQTGQRCSAIDLTMVTSDLFFEADWSTGIDHCSLTICHCTLCWVRQTLASQKLIELLNTSTRGQTGTCSSLF